ncbi:Peptidyl-prolyl isomerase CWC27 [Vanrija pseudolonga]|uniref:Peptidyl-prolyl isomerase CWC27 n=1 Tax=Vanrija pseudolonga TaxID=143232 RepID=A0AAF0YGR5_9TREE|nr:Peptidyl-prolyl isomerase CWC27 [Vanrija pseudolonga]
MSNLYATEPTPNGKVIVDTTAGEIEIELWGKEAPKAVRNFLQLAMEGYYDGVIFHRIVKDFIIQTGDPTGTGMGGESIYGEPFSDEIHSRLRFNRRGLLGMANNSKRNTNNSQWFITLDRADELTGRHTLFGRIQGPTYYNVLNIGNLEVDAEEKPLVPPKIRGIRIIENPFDDIVPRITAAEKRAQIQARIELKKENEIREKRARAKKNTGLLSFGDAEEEQEAAVVIKKKDMSRSDLVAGQSRDSSEPVASKSADEPRKAKREDSPKARTEERKTVDLKSIRSEHERQKLGDKNARSSKIDRLQDDLRYLKKRQGEGSDSESDDSTSHKKRRKGADYLEEEMAKYTAGRGRAAKRSYNRKSRRDDDDDLMKDLSMFSKKVLAVDPDAAYDSDDEKGAEGGEEGVEVDDDVGWLRHALKFQHEVSDETRRAEDEYTVIDPRAKARELAADEERKAKERIKSRK